MMHVMMTHVMMHLMVNNRTHGIATTKQPPQNRYLAHAPGTDGGKLRLEETRPVVEENQALQREFLAALTVIVDGNINPTIVRGLRNEIRRKPLKIII
jgi:hypothetical protein